MTRPEGWPEAAMKANVSGVEALCLNTGQLSARLPFSLNTLDMEQLGIHPYVKIKAGAWWRVEDVPSIIRKLFESACLNVGMPVSVAGAATPLKIEVVQTVNAEELKAAREGFASDEVRIEDSARVRREPGAVWVEAWLLLEETP